MPAISALRAMTKFNPRVWLRALSENDLAILPNDGAPVDGTSGTFVGKAGPGCLLVDFTNAVLYINTGTKASPTWTIVGTQA